MSRYAHRSTRLLSISSVLKAKEQTHFNKLNIPNKNTRIGFFQIYRLYYVWFVFELKFCWISVVLDKQKA